MKQYFKDYKTKMLKDEELVKEQSIVNVQVQSEEKTGKGLFVKKKIIKENCDETKSQFLFNFSTEVNDDVSSKIASIKL